MSEVLIHHVTLAACEASGFSIAGLKGHTRQKAAMYLRRVTWYVAVDIYGHSTVAVGVSFRRDHSSVRSGLARMRRFRFRDPGFDALVIHIARRAKQIAERAPATWVAPRRAIPSLVPAKGGAWRLEIPSTDQIIAERSAHL